MKSLFLNLVEIRPDDPVAFTFFVGYMAMFAASVFFFFERSRVDDKWKVSLLISGLITGIAAVHYFYMRDYFQEFGTNPTVLRYIDWTLTVPLMCVEFYLLLRPAGAKISLMVKLIAASVLMLVAGYIGEAFGDGSMGHSILWGVISTIGYVYILYTAFFGEVKKLAANNNSDAVKKGIKALGWFVFVGWAIYPIGYMAMPGGWLGPDGAGLLQPADMDLIYNIGDAVNKIGFGLVVYGIAIKETMKARKANAISGGNGSTVGKKREKANA